MASKIKNQIADNLPLFAEYIAKKKLDSTQRVDAGLNYLLNHIKEEINISNFEAECGVGIVISPEEVECEVEKVIRAHKTEIVNKRYACLT